MKEDAAMNKADAKQREEVRQFFSDAWTNQRKQDANAAIEANMAADKAAKAAAKLEADKQAAIKQAHDDYYADLDRQRVQTGIW